MIHYLSDSGWEELNASGNSIRYMTEYTGADNISGVEKLAEYIEFGFDVYLFVDNSKNGEKSLLHFTDKEKAEAEFNRLIESLMLKKSFHDIVEYMNKVIDVSHPDRMIEFVIDNRHTPLYQVAPTHTFQYGVVDKRYEGSIRVHKYNAEDFVNVYYTFGIKILDDTSLAIIIGYEGFSVMDKDDCKKVFEYTQDEKLDKEETDLVIKRLRDNAK